MIGESWKGQCYLGRDGVKMVEDGGLCEMDRSDRVLGTGRIESVECSYDVVEPFLSPGYIIRVEITIEFLSYMVFT